MPTQERFTCQNIIDALEETKGMVYLAADVLGCSHTTVYNYIKRHPSVKEAYDRHSGRMTDKTEQKLFSAIEEGKPWAITFYLGTKGKDRGYTRKEEREVYGRDGGPVLIQVDR